MNFIGLDWEQRRIPFSGLPNFAFIMKNQDFGEIYVDDDAIRDISYAHKDVEFQNSVMEVQLSGKTCFLCHPVSLPKYRAFFANTPQYDVVGWQELLDNYPRGLEEQTQRVLVNLKNATKGYGEDLSRLNRQMFFARTDDELKFMRALLKDKGYLTFPPDFVGGELNLNANGYRLEYSGWLEIEKIDAKAKTKNVFIAMMFDPKMNRAYESLYKAVKDLGLNPIRVDKLEHNEWITGEILHQIRQSTCVIADVTGQRNGVYFEAGYAMGMKLQVIFSCDKREFDDGKVHFDTKQYNHVVWENEDDLYEKMKARIRGTIL